MGDDLITVQCSNSKESFFENFQHFNLGQSFWYLLILFTLNKFLAMKNSILFMFISSHFWYNVEIKNCSNIVFEKDGLHLEYCMDNQIFRYWTLCKLNGTIFQTVFWKIRTLNHSSKNWYYRIYKILLFISFLIKLFFLN